MANIAGKNAAGTTIYLKASGAGSDVDPHIPENRRAVPTAAAMTSASLNISSSGDNTVVSAQSGQTVRLHKLLLVAVGAVNVKFKDGAGTDLTPALPLQAGGSIVLDFDGEPWFVTSSGNALIINLSAAVQVSGRLYYTQS